MIWYEDYPTYLKSDRFAELKAEMKERCGGICERCRFFPYDDTHHVNYEKKWGTETAKDLAGVCRGCHNLLGGRSKDDPLDLIKPTIFLTGDIRRSRLEGVLEGVDLFTHESNCKIEEYVKYKYDYMVANIVNQDSTYLNDQIEYACKKGLSCYIFFPILTVKDAATLRKCYARIYNLQNSDYVRIYHHQSSKNVLILFYAIRNNWKIYSKDLRICNFEEKKYLK